MRILFTFLLIIISINFSYPQYYAYRGGYLTKMGNQWHEYSYNEGFQHFINKEISQDDNFYYLEGVENTKGFIIAIPKSKSIKNGIMVGKGKDWLKAVDIISMGEDNPGHSPRAFVYDNGIFMLIKGKMCRYDKSSKLGKYEEYEIYKTTDAFYLIRNSKEHIGVPRNWYDSFQKYDSKNKKWVTFSKAVALYDIDSPKSDAGIHFDDDPQINLRNNQSTSNSSNKQARKTPSTPELNRRSSLSEGNLTQMRVSDSGKSYTTTREETSNGNFNIIKHYSDGRKDKLVYSRCGVCLGNTKCDNCKGKRICDYCNGIGRSFGPISNQCIICNGTGRCKNCNGDGKCHYCLNQSEYPGFSKVITIRYDSNGNAISDGTTPNSNAINTNNSYNSNPSNTQKSRVCPSCHGKGVVYKYSNTCYNIYNDCKSEFCNTCGDSHCKVHGWHKQCDECNGHQVVNW